MVSCSRLLSIMTHEGELTKLPCRTELLAWTSAVGNRHEVKVPDQDTDNATDCEPR